ncbi:MAG: hypothetical protein ACK4UN_09350 [Limisphaerales bacterium]
MDLVSIIKSVASKSGVFALVVSVLALIARVEPGMQAEDQQAAPMTRTVKQQVTSEEPMQRASDWHKGSGWRRNG